MGNVMNAKHLRETLRGLADPAIAEHSQRFFKAGKGEYGEGDRFLGIRVPVLRREARRHLGISIAQLLRLLRSRYHEERLCALLIMVLKYQRGSEEERAAIYQHYLENTDCINNWDLVDSSAHSILGAHLKDRERGILYRLARSESLWERRIAIMATLHFIKNREYGDTLKLSHMLLEDSHDLIHKAVGWMLREVGNRAPRVERAFLNSHYRQMPRTMLRYAIEKFPEKERKAYLNGRL
ncbi:MAG: DNA alkylation repair protein [Candidatus Thiodiazotropha sp. (ex Codakia orbicularis)]|nr:DNA alkylation repair protein [Candidatus Thiodiazotropha sp. (ex Codakia orbicularis)]